MNGCEELHAEIKRLKTALDLTRAHNRKLAEENARLREGRGLPPPDPMEAHVEVRIARNMLPPAGPIVIPVHPDLLPPPPPPPKPSRGPRRFRTPYAGERPLRTQWPIEDNGEVR